MTKIFSKVAINYSQRDAFVKIQPSDNHSQETSSKTTGPNCSSKEQSPDTLPLGAYVDDYKTAYQWAKNWRAET